MEFCWFQANPSQSFRLRMTEKQFLDAQKRIRSKSKLIIVLFNEMNHFIDIFENY